METNMETDLMVVREEDDAVYAPGAMSLNIHGRGIS